jgi:sugar O-acyltransferase (sialic acid O-acetyltransferase NeuD family)
MDVVVFGAGSFASVVWYMLSHDSPHRVVGFTADRTYCTEPRLHGLPVVPFDALEAEFPAGQVDLVLAVGAHGVNRLRSERYLEAKARGYGFASYISSRASVWPDLQAGDGCLIFDGAKVNPFAIIGNNCLLGSGIHVSHHAQVGDHCYFAPHAVVAGRARIGQRCFLGVNSSVRDGVNVADRCVLAAGAVVTADTLENGVYMGVPARRHPTPAEDLEA